MGRPEEREIFATHRKDHTIDLLPRQTFPGKMRLLAQSGADGRGK